MENFLIEFSFRINSMGPLAWLDVILVTAVIFLFLLLLRRSQAAFILRGILVLVAILAITTLFLPLPTFDVILWIGLLAVLIATPIILQPELRRMLERIGREIGFNFLSEQRETAEQLVPQLLRATENLSANQTGALIVLEKEMPLDKYMASGVRVDGRVSAELLQTIFHNKTPLHDGACIIRSDQVEAAGCVLPLTDQALPSSRRLGTRHRAAVGMSEASDALVVVVSEETGTISVAQAGRLDRGLDSSGLRQRLVNFYSETPESPKRRPFARVRLRRPSFRQLLEDLVYLVISFLFALAASTFVAFQQDPSIASTMTNVPLNVTGLPEDTALMEPLPTAIEIDYVTLESINDQLSPDSFEANVSLEGLDPEPQIVPIDVVALVENVVVEQAVPSEVDVQIAPIVTATVPVTIQLTDEDNFSAAYEVSSDPFARPSEVTISGAQPQVERVISAEVSVSLSNETGPIQETRTVRLVDAEGEVVDSVSAEPPEVVVNVPIRSRIDARNVGVRVVTSNSPPEGYWLSGLSSTPNNVIVQGDPAVINDLESFIDTLPVDLAQLTGPFEGDVPLDLPDDVTAFDARGNEVTTVLVSVLVSARRGDLLIERPVEIVNDFGQFEIDIDPTTVELLLTGPLPTLSEIEQNPELVRVVIDAALLEPDSQVTVTPQVLSPEALTRADLIQTEVLVTTSAVATPTPEPEN